jgi:TonB family protein
MAWLLAAGSVVAGDLAQPKQLWVSAPITIDAAGNASIGKIKGASGGLAAVLKARLEKEKYVAASRDGTAVASQMHIAARAGLTPSGGDDYSITLDSIVVAPLLRKAGPPRYPLGMARNGLSGYVTLALTVAADGKVIRAHSVDASDAFFSKEVLAVAKRWRFESASVDGSKFEYEVTLPIVFNASQQRQSPKFSCRLDARAPRWSKQTEGVCLDLLEITLGSVRTNSAQ